MESTLTEPPIEPAAETAALLTYVLDYENLLADDAATIELTGKRLAIGRAAEERSGGMREGALTMADRWMSGEHAELVRRGRDWIVRDLSSRNGTYVNGERVTEQPLASGDLIEVGHRLLCFSAVSPSAASAVARPAAERRLGGIVTQSADLALLLADLRRLAPSTQPILILAETGAGKESLAAEIHRLSGRRGELCPIDCGAIPETLFESTFFGHRRGAFTGAAEHRTGEIARAEGGTLFLDEIANLPLASQGKLLRVMETGRVTALGASEARTVDVRWVSATNRDLFAEGVPFREDLLRRLAGYVARIPPLRRRREDLGVLVAALLRAAQIGRASISVAAARALFTGELPGNVRQLRAAIVSGALLAAEGPIGIEHLPVETAAGDPDDADGATADPPRKLSSAPDADAVEAALAESGGNVVRAAERLRTRPRQLYRWIERFAIDLDKYRAD